jgi:serine/threonine protein phosphatase 1
MIHLLGKVNTRIDKYSKNEVGSDYVCGDIHGIFSVVIEKLEAINFNFETDRLFCTGDLIDRGPESHMVLEFLSAPWIFPVLGNHEQMIIDGEETVWNGAGWWRDIEQDEKDKIREKFKTLPLAIELETDKGLIGILHAECPTNDWAEFEDLLAKDHRHTCELPRPKGRGFLLH